MDLAVFIPAVKKNVAFADDLVKKLAGSTLIQRAIDKAQEIVPLQHIYVVTDSEEICLICQRNGVHYDYEKDLRLSSLHIIDNLKFILSKYSNEYKDMILLSPYAPLLRTEDMIKALKYFRSKKDCRLLIPIKNELSRVFKENKRGLEKILTGSFHKKLLIESQAFKIINSSLVAKGIKIKKVTPATYELTHDLLEIRSYQDWWVSEKLLRRKKVVFRIIGDEQIGMGHIYRALTLAQEITDHEVYFVCDENSRDAAQRLAGDDYWLGIYKKREIADRIIDLNPDLVINDILDTNKNYIMKLRNKGIKVINFEDLGTGARHSNLTVNELYETPEFEGKNILWGRKHFFLREEFSEARPGRFKNKVDTALVTFGAADPNDFTRKIFKNISSYCAQNNIKIFLVTGGGYSHIEKLEKEIESIPKSVVQYVHITGAMSHIMEQSQIAIAANGRTPYELAHMNIPSIILSHHERENSHSFATRDNGFIPIGLYQGRETDKTILNSFRKLAEDKNFRKVCFDKMKPFKFQKNKERVLNLILQLLTS